MSDAILFFIPYRSLSQRKKPQLNGAALKSNVFMTLVGSLQDGAKHQFLRDHPTSFIDWASPTKDSAIIEILTAAMACPIDTSMLTQKFISVSRKEAYVYYPAADYAEKQDRQIFEDEIINSLGNKGAGLTWISQNTITAKTFYQPHGERFAADPITGKDHFNLWGPPKWLKSRNYETDKTWLTDGKLDADVREFLHHLFPLKEARVASYGWLRDAVFTRAHTILCLLGSHGTGKGILLTNMLGGCLSGERSVGNKRMNNNNRSAPRGAETSVFHGNVVNTQHYMANELYIKGHLKENMKDFAGEEATPESKGENPEEPTFMTASLSIVNNKPFKNVIDPMDRRFLIPEITETDLREIWDQEKIKDFVDSWTDAERCRRLVSFLYLRIPKDTTYRPVYKGKFFYAICRASIPHWFQAMFYQLKKEDEVRIPLNNRENHITFESIAERIHWYEKSYGVRVGIAERLFVSRAALVKVTSCIRGTDVEIGVVQRGQV